MSLVNRVDGLITQQEIISSDIKNTVISTSSLRCAHLPPPKKMKDYKEPPNCYEIPHHYSQNWLCYWNATTYVFVDGRNKTRDDADVLRKEGFQLKIRYNCETKKVTKKKTSI